MTANSPGINQILERLDWPAESVRVRAAHIQQWVVANDIIGCYGQHVGTTFLVPSVPMQNSVFDPHRAWGVLKAADAREARPSFDVAWRDLLQRHPEAELLLPLLQNGTLTVADLYAISLYGISEAVLVKMGLSQVSQTLVQIFGGFGSLFS
jgi:hypothetical protein